MYDLLSTTGHYVYTSDEVTTIGHIHIIAIYFRKFAPLTGLEIFTTALF